VEDSKKKIIYRDIPEDSLTGIIYGSQIDDTNKKIIRGMVERREQPIEQFEAKLKDDEYGLDIDPIT
jgi:hypothetical protein